MGTEISLGQRIREVRLQKKLTQSDVVGDYMTRNMLSKIENGSAAPSVRTLEFLALSLEVPVSYFLDGGDRESLDTENLREIDELARMLMVPANAPLMGGIALCVRARVMMAAGRPDSALSLFEGFKPEEYPEEAQNQIYYVIEDCCRLKGDYKKAYEYAIKRLDSK